MMKYLSKIGLVIALVRGWLFKVRKCASGGDRLFVLGNTRVVVEHGNLQLGKSKRMFNDVKISCVGGEQVPAILKIGNNVSIGEFQLIMETREYFEKVMQAYNQNRNGRSLLNIPSSLRWEAENRAVR